MGITSNNSPYSEERLRAFVSGRLSEADAAPIEERLIADEDFFDEVRQAEEELIDEFVLGTLSPAEDEYVRKRSESQSAWAERIALRKVLFSTLKRADTARPQPIRAVEARRETRSGWFFPPKLWTLGWAAATVVLLIFCALLLRERNDLRSSLLQRQRMTMAQAVAPVLVRPPVAAATTSTATLFFPEFASRGASAVPSIKLHADPERVVELQLELPAGFSPAQSWSVEVSGPSGAAVSWTGLRAQQVGSVFYVQAAIGSSTLEPGQYEVQLAAPRTNGNAPVKTWSLTVVR